MLSEEVDQSSNLTPGNGVLSFRPNSIFNAKFFLFSDDAVGGVTPGTHVAFVAKIPNRPIPSGRTRPKLPSSNLLEEGARSGWLGVWSSVSHFSNSFDDKAGAFVFQSKLRRSNLRASS